jgi:thioredoxin-like negative regulator of GroEL
MTIEIESVETLESSIQEEVGLLLYFSTPTCNVCHALKPKIIEAFHQEFPKIKQCFIDAAAYPQIPASLGIFAVPTIMIYLDGKEFARESRNVSIPQLVEKISRPYDMLLS